MTRLIQLAHQTPTQMMGYVLVAPSGDITVIDGGMTGDAEHLLAVLREVGGAKPRVKHWFMTHAHLDHCDAFLALWPRHGADFTLDKLYFCFPSARVVEQYEPFYERTAQQFEALEGELAPYTVTPKVGDRFDLGGMTMEVMQTFVPEETMNCINNSSMVLRLAADGVTTIFLGDLGEEAGARLLARWGDQLKCDVVECAHHGQSGVRMDVYDAMKPELLLWNTPTWLWENTLDKDKPHEGPWKTLETRAHFAKMGVTRNVITKDGTQYLSFEGGKARVDRVDPHTGE